MNWRRRSPAVRHDPDEYRLPYSRWTQERISGVEIAATAFANLMREDPLRFFNQDAQLVMLIAGALLFGCGLVWLRPWWAVGLSAFAALTIALANGRNGIR